MTETTTANMNSLNEDPAAAGLLIAELGLNPVRGYSTGTRDFLRIKKGEAAALTAVAQYLTVKTTKSGKLKSAQADFDCWKGKTWWASMILDLDPSGGLFSLDVGRNSQWVRPYPARRPLICVQCCGAFRELVDEKENARGPELQFHVSVRNFRPDTLDVPKRDVGPPVSFIAGEHLTSGAVFMVINRIFAIYAGRY